MGYFIRLKRVYAPSEEDDGRRIFVDRLWARGLKKDAAGLDLWAKEIAPSTALRQIYHRGEMDFDAFSKAYADELDASDAARNFARQCRTWLEGGNVTLLYAAKNEAENHALVLRAWLEKTVAGMA